MPIVEVICYNIFIFSMIFRNQLQLLGSVCLLVSWKVREHSSITAQKLIEFTDFNVSLDDLLVRFSPFVFIVFFCFHRLNSRNCPCRIKL